MVPIARGFEEIELVSVNYTFQTFLYYSINARIYAFKTKL